VEKKLAGSLPGSQSFEPEVVVYAAWVDPPKKTASKQNASQTYACTKGPFPGLFPTIQTCRLLKAFVDPRFEAIASPREKKFVLPAR
jgi:hypothetical protein